MNRRALSVSLLLLILLTLAAGALSIYNLHQQLPYAQWRGALWHPDIDNVQQMLFHYSLLPRVVVALLAGAGLGLVGLLFQQVLRNPLAEPATLGVSAGAQLGLTVATLWALPGGMITQQFAAMTGAVVIGALVFGIAWGKRMSPVTLILAGLVLGLYCSAVNGLIGIFNYQNLQSLYMWSSGALNQQDWDVASFLLPRVIIVWLLAFLLQRPMTLLGLDDGVAKNLGLGLSAARLAVLTLAILMSAQLVNAVGIIGFIGLFAPLLAKMLGARRLAVRLVMAPVIGALLLWFTDQVMQTITTFWMEIPTGAATA
ncbi:iron ABC transporter permease, partial [Rahnella perminowiae]